MERGKEEIPCVFFFSGERLPRYASRSLKSIAKNWPGRVVLLTDVAKVKLPSRVEVVYFPRWFSYMKYHQFIAQTPLDANFRAGFWVKTAMRFFVILEWLKQAECETLLHLELDSALIQTDELEEYFHSLGPGLYVPVVSKDIAIASILFLKGVEPLEALVSFMVENSHLGSEMTMVAHFVAEHSSVAFGLPTPFSFARDFSLEDRHHILSPTVNSGVFDPAQIGHWLLGPDPRNIRGKFVRANYEYNYGEDSKERFRQVVSMLSWDRDMGLVMSNDGKKYPIRNIHVHSKVLENAYSRFLLRLHFNRAKKERSLAVFCAPAMVPLSKSRLKRAVDVFLVRANRFFWRP